MVFRYVHPKAAPVIWDLARQVWIMTRTTAPHVWIGRGWDGKSSEHGTGRALDIIVTKGVGVRATKSQVVIGDLIADWLIRNADTLHIRHIIWNRRIWRRRYRAWGALPGRTARSNVSDWHEDHIHVYLDDSTGSVPKTALRKEETMSKTDRNLTDADIDALVRYLLNWKLTANGKDEELVQHMAEGFVADRAQSLALAQINERLSAMHTDLALVKKKVGI